MTHGGAARSVEWRTSPLILIHDPSRWPRGDLQELFENADGITTFVADNCAQEGQNTVKYREVYKHKSHLERPTRDAV